MSRTMRWCFAFALGALPGCDRAPVAPENFQTADARAGPTPRPEIVFRTLDRRQISYYVMNADGDAKTLVTSGRSAMAEPVWSSQGSGTSADPYRFAWGDSDAQTGQGCELFVTDVVVSGTTVVGLPRVHVPTTPKKATYPDQSLACGIAWSPIGPQVAFSTAGYAGTTGGPELWIVNIPPATGGDRRVYAGSRRLSAPTWSRDGSHLLVVETTPDYLQSGDRLLLVEVATGAARVILEEAPNWQLADPEFARRSNDLLYRRTAYSTGCGTPSCNPADGQGLYRLPLDSAYAPGVPAFVLDVRSGSWAPDDAAFVGESWGGGLVRYDFATRTMTTLASKGKAPDWR